MTSNEFKSAQAKIGCTGVQLAKWLKTTPETVSYWRSGRNIPGPVALAMQALASGWRP